MTDEEYLRGAIQLLEDQQRNCREENLTEFFKIQRLLIRHTLRHLRQTLKNELSRTV